MKKHVLIDGLAVDLEALLSMEHCCRPELCKDDKCCCSYYEIDVDGEELKKILGFIPLAAGYNTPERARRMNESLFRFEGRGNYVIATDADEYCGLIYFGALGQPLCTLHAGALEQQIPPAEIKPLCCTLWPLALDRQPIPILTIHDEAFSFVCNRKRQGYSTRLDPGVGEIVSSVYGRSFLGRLKKAIKKFRAG